MGIFLGLTLLASSPAEASDVLWLMWNGTLPATGKFHFYPAWEYKWSIVEGFGVAKWFARLPVARCLGGLFVELLWCTSIEESQHFIKKNYKTTKSSSPLVEALR